MRVLLVKYRYDNSIHCIYYCPGCSIPHSFNPLVHNWNGDRESPTVYPSLLHNNPQGHQRCHSFIKSGMIQFCNDSWHNLKGQTVELPEFNLITAGFDIDSVEILNS